MDENNVSNVSKITSITKAVLPSGHKSWTTALIEQNLLSYLRQLKSLGRLESIFPGFYGMLRIFRPHPMDVETVLSITSDLELQGVAETDLINLTLEFFSNLSVCRYDNHSLSISNQISLIPIIVSFCIRIHSEEIKIFAFKSENIMSWRKLPFDLEPPKMFGIGPDYALSRQGDGITLNEISVTDLDAKLSDHCPAWDSLLSTATNKKAIVGWLGSLMDRSRTNTQFLFLYGEGNDGKGTLMKALHGIFEDRLMFQGQIPVDDKGALRFFNENLEGKLLLGCSEFPDKELFGSYLKALTGGDALQIEPKGKKSRNAINHLKIYISSNWRPNIPNTEAARRRVIYGEMTSVPKEKVIVDFEQHLLREADSFFSLAYYVYRGMKYLNRITQDTSVYQANYAASNESMLTKIMNAFFIYELPESAFETSDLLKRELPHMTATGFEDYCRDQFPGTKSDYIRRIIQEFKGVAYAKKLALKGGTKSWCYMGIEPRKYKIENDTVLVDHHPTIKLVSEYEPVDDPGSTVP